MIMNSILVYKKFIDVHKINTKQSIKTNILLHNQTLLKSTRLTSNSRQRVNISCFTYFYFV